MQFQKSVKKSIQDLNQYSNTDIKLLCNKFKIPFITKSQAINILSYELIKDYFHQRGTMDVANVQPVPSVVSDTPLLNFLSDKIGQDITKYILYPYLKVHSELIPALKNNDITNAIILIENGIDVKKVNSLNETSLMYAIKINNIYISKLLIAKGVDINTITNNRLQNTALSIAITNDNDNIELVKLLFDNGADINNSIKNITESLIKAIQKTNLNIVKFIVEKGANVNTIHENNTLLLQSINAKKVSVNFVKFLIEKGANVNFLDNNSKTPLIYSIENNYIDIVKLLIDNKADINVVGPKPYKKTILMYAIDMKNIDLIKLLIDKGLDVNAQDSNNMTPLMYVAEHSTLDSLKFLMDNTKNLSYNNLCVISLTNTSDSYALAVMKLLIDNGAKINAKSRDNISALGYALSKNMNDNIEYLKTLT